MRTLYYTALLTLFAIASLSAQSLYQDALSLSEILRKERQTQNRALENEIPKLVFEKVRRGISCNYNQYSPIPFFQSEEELQAARDAGFYFPEIWENQLFLNDQGYYTLQGFDQTDSIYIDFTKDWNIKIYSEADSLVFEKIASSEDENDILKFPADSLLSIHNSYKKLRILGSNKQVLVQYEQKERDSEVRAYNRRIILRPENWHQAPVSELIGIKQEDQSGFTYGELPVSSPFEQNKARLLDGYRFTLKQDVWSSYLIHFKQGEEYLTNEYRPIRIIDTLQVTYDRAQKQLSGVNVNEAYNYKNIDLKKDSLSSLRFHGYLQYELKEKNEIYALDLDGLKQHPNYRPPNDSSILMTQETERYGYNYSYEVDTLTANSSAFELPIIVNNDSLWTYLDVRYQENAELFPNHYTLWLLTDQNGKLYSITSYNGVSYNGDFLYYTYPFNTVPFLYKTRDLNDVAFILSTHHNFNNKDLYQEGILKETLSAYKRNEILSDPLNTYLSKEKSIEKSLNSNDTWKLDAMYQQYYPWQGVLYQDLQLNLSKKTSYQAVLANARQKANTASKNLQRVTQQLATQQKATRGGGLNAATIAAGLSDFIVESAQEELNMNFLARMRDQITNNYPEFQILFPNTIERFTDFQVTQYRSFLGNSKLVFEADLNNIGFSFPTLFTDEKTRAKYAVLADDPNVYNISLVYDIANKVYEETPIDSVFLHLYTRLDDRLNDLDKRVINTISGQLVKSEEGKTEVAYLQEETQAVFDEIDDFDFLIQVENENMWSVLDSLQRKQQEIGEKTRKSYLEAAKKIYSNQYAQNDSYYLIQNIADSNMVASYTPYGNIIRSNQIPDSLRSTSRKMGNNFIAPIQLNPIADSVKNENIISYGNEQFVTSTKLKQYEAVINTSLAGKIRYDYMLKKLPYEQFDDYFKTVPTDSMMVSEGLFLLDDLLKEEQLLLRRAWLKNYSDFLASNLSTLKEQQRNQARTSNPYPDELAHYHQLYNQQQAINNMLRQRIDDLKQKAKTFKLLEELLQTLDKNYAALTRTYERAKEEGKNEEQLDRIIEKQLDRDRDYLQEYVEQRKKKLYEFEADKLVAESNKILENLAVRYKKLKENNASTKSLSQQLEAGIEATNRSFEIRFDKIESAFFQKQEQYKDKNTRFAALEKYKRKEEGYANRNFNSLEESIVNQADSVEFNILQGQLRAAETAFSQRLDKAFSTLDEAIENMDRLEWKTQKDAEKMVERRVSSLEKRLDEKKLASQIKLKRIIKRKREAIEHLIDRQFNDLEKKLLKENNGRLSSRKDAELGAQRESVKNLLHRKVDQISGNLSKEETSVDRSKSLIHAAQSLEYLRLKLEDLYSMGNNNGREPSSDQYRNQELNRAIEAFHVYQINSYSLNKEQLDAIEERARSQEELISKMIEVLTRLEAEYGAEERKHQYIPAPSQTQINEILNTLPDSSKTELLIYYGFWSVEKDFYYSEYLNSYSNRYGQGFLLRDIYKRSQDTLYLNSAEYLEQLQGEELILIRKLDKGEQSLDFANYFERSLELNKTMDLWLDSIALQFDTVRKHYTRLEAEYAERAYGAKKHARDLSTLTEVSVHLLDAFRLGSFEMDSITVADTLRQRIEETVENKKISYDRLAVQQKVIAKGKSVNKWISREQFRGIMEDSLRQQAYLGLLYQRLSNIKGFGEITPNGVALVSSKLINTIYNMDDLRATLQYKKRLGKTLGFQDYYPFIRTTVDFINIVLETPIGERSFSEQHEELRTFALISDQSLKLFDNISSENYGQSIDNLINIFSYIWDVDVEQATTEQQWAQALPALKLQGKDKEVAAIEKQLKKTENEEKRELRKGQKNNRKLKKALTVYGKFIANIAMAEDANSVKAALRAVAAPPGSSSVKRNSRVNISLNSYFGGGFYQEQLNLNGLTKAERTSGTIGLSVPVGVTGTIGGLGKNNWSVSLFMPILDLGIFTAYRIDQQNAGQSADLPDLNFGNLIAPGGFLIVNIPKSPFSISGGAQFGPQLRETTVNGTAELTSAWRYGFTATIDVPIFNLFNR